MLTGDTHGDINWFRTYLLPVAWAINAEALVVLGDFGAWEHISAGVRFFNDVSLLSAKIGVDIYWLHGNHDKWSHTIKEYGHLRTEDGFVVCRENVYYIPQAHAWTWGKVSFRSFGGAYSIDKAWRLDTEKAREEMIRRERRSRVGQGSVLGTDTIASQAQTLWFPEEEMTDDEMEQFLRDDFGPKDVILSHDKPMSAKPDWGRMEYPACIPNQIRLEHALRVHQPKWWFHGHLHYFYSTMIGKPGWQCRVVGLEPNASAAEHSGWRREHSWVQLDCYDELSVHSGASVAPLDDKLDEGRKLMLSS